MPVRNPLIRTPITAAQFRILKALYESKGTLSRERLSERSNVTANHCSNAAGPFDSDRRKKTEDRTGNFTLITLGLVGCDEYEVNDKREQGYYLTEKGRQFIEDIPQAILDRGKVRRRRRKKKLKR